MKKIHLATAIFLVFAVISCSVSGRKYEGSFKEYVPLQADSIRIDQIIKIDSWTRAGDKAVVFSPLSENVFYVYKLPEFSFLYSLGQKGEGPGDFSDFMKFPDGNIMNNDLYVYDIGSSQGPVYVISLSDTSYTQKRISGIRKGFNYIVSDSVWISYIPVSVDYADMSVKGRMSIWDGHGREIEKRQLLTHTGQFGFTYRDMQNKSGLILRGDTYNKAGVTTNGKKLAVYYPDVFRMELYKLNPDGSLEFEKFYGETYTLDQLNGMDMENRKKGEGLAMLRSTDDYIYAFKYEYANNGDGREPVRSYLEIYDWEGQGIAKYDLGRYFDKYIVDGNTCRIFCYHTGSDFDYVYVYEYGLP